MDSRIDPCRFAGSRSVKSAELCIVLALALSACATQAPSGSGEAARGALETTKAEECSIVGLMACKATGLLSGNASGSRQAVCTVTKNSTGARTESCGSIETQATASKPEPAVNSSVSVRLGWSDNSSDESGFVIERCDQISFKGEGEKKVAVCNSGWTIVGSVGANVTSYFDNSALANHTYLYRVKAVNRAGASGYTTEGVITTGAK